MREDGWRPWTRGQASFLPGLAPVIGHRGAAARAPENTLAGLRKAHALGASWVEFDVMLSGDEVPLLIHDETLRRTTSGRGRVPALSAAAIRALDAGSWFDGTFAGERVPTLEEAVALLLDLGLHANLEVKPARGFERRTGEVVARTLARIWPADGPRLLDWSHAIVKMYEISTDDEHRAAAERAAGEFIDYVTALIDERRTQPRDDLISQLIGIADQGDRLTQDEIVGTVIVLLNAGHEATVNTLGNGMRALLRHPDQWARVVGGEVDPATAVEEMIRWDGPLQLFERWVLDDGVEIAGQPLAVGQRIAMLFGSANRDPARFADPDRFDVARGDSGHIGFGGGTHFCIGAPLARLEIAVSLDQLRRDCPRIEAVAEPEYEPFFVIRGLRELRVRW